MAAIEMRELARLLDTLKGIDEFVVTRRRQLRSIRYLGTTAQRALSDSTVISASIFRDSREGRGSASFSLLSESAAEARLLAEVAVDSAKETTGPPWALPAPASPARVQLADHRVIDDPAAAVDLMVSALTKASRDVVIGEAQVGAVAEEIAVETSQGFASKYAATQLTIDAVMRLRDNRAAGAVDRISLNARQLDDIDAQGAITRAVERLRNRALATPLAPGTYDVVIKADQLTNSRTATDTEHGQALYGWLDPLVRQTDGRTVRHGLSRYRVGQSIFGDVVNRDLSIASDGAINFAQLSRPFGDSGEPTRRFSIVTRGVASDVGLDLREAALRRTSPNGGVRNLVVQGGSTAASELVAADRRPVLEIERLAWSSLDSRSGLLSAEIALAFVTSDGARRPVTGGSIAANIFELWSRVIPSAETALTGWYLGPIAVRFPNITVR